MTTDEQAATIAELRRPIAQWRGMTPSAVCAGSEAQKLYCIQDAQADILTQAAEIERLRLSVSAAHAEIKNLANEVNQHDQKEGKSQFALDKAEARATAAEQRVKELEVGPDEMTFLEATREAIAGEEGPENLYTEEMVDRLLFAAEKDFDRLKAQIKWLERNSVLKNPAQVSIFDRATAAERALAEMQAQRDVLEGALSNLESAVRGMPPSRDDLCDSTLYHAIEEAQQTLATLPASAARYRAVVEAAVAIHRKCEARSMWDGKTAVVTFDHELWRAFCAACLVFVSFNAEKQK